MPTGNCCCVGEHADGTLNFGQVAAGDNGGRLIVDPNFETYD